MTRWLAHSAGAKKVEEFADLSPSRIDVVEPGLFLASALHANAKAEAGYRFYALYDKISREDILAMPMRSAAPIRPSSADGDSARQRSMKSAAF